MKPLKQIKEQIAMSVGSNANAGGIGGIAGLEPDLPPVPAGVTTKGHMLRRKSPLNTFKNYLRGKRK